MTLSSVAALSASDRRFLMIAGALAAGVVAVHLGLFLLIGLLTQSGIDDWKLTQWVFSYEYGFTKRALPGAMLSWLAPPAHLFAATVLSHVANVLLTILFIAAIWQPYRTTRDSALWLFVLVAATHSGTLQHFFSDVGRFDQLLLILALAALLPLAHLPQAARFMVATAAAVSMLLIHEAALIALFPLLWTYWAYRNHLSGVSHRALAASVVVTLGAFLLIQAHGAPDIQFADHFAALTERFGSFVTRGAVLVLHQDLRDSIAFTFGVYSTPQFALQQVLLLIGLLPTLLFIAAFMRALFKRVAVLNSGDRLALLVLLSAFAPLALYAVGIDFGRWWTLALCNFFVVVALLSRTSPAVFDATRATLASHRLLVLGILLSNLVFGPLGIASSYGRFQALLLLVLEAAGFDSVALELGAALGK